jgi:hypothetical protein
VPDGRLWGKPLIRVNSETLAFRDCIGQKGCMHSDE